MPTNSKMSLIWILIQIVIKKILWDLRELKFEYLLDIKKLLLIFNEVVTVLVCDFFQCPFLKILLKYL